MEIKALMTMEHSDAMRIISTEDSIRTLIILYSAEGLNEVQ